MATCEMQCGGYPSDPKHFAPLFHSFMNIPAKPTVPMWNRCRFQKSGKQDARFKTKIIIYIWLLTQLPVLENHAVGTPCNSALNLVQCFIGFCAPLAVSHCGPHHRETAHQFPKQGSAQLLNDKQKWLNYLSSEHSRRFETCVRFQGVSHRQWTRTTHSCTTLGPALPQLRPRIICKWHEELPIKKWWAISLAYV